MMVFVVHGTQVPFSHFLGYGQGKVRLRRLGVLVLLPCLFLFRKIIFLKKIGQIGTWFLETLVLG